MNLNHQFKKHIVKLIQKLNQSLKVCLLFFIYFYRSTLALFFGGSCRFEPSCSSYAQSAIKEYSLIAALSLIIKRILKCHPFGKEGYDPLPLKTIQGKK